MSLKRHAQKTKRNPRRTKLRVSLREINIMVARKGFFFFFNICTILSSTVSNGGSELATDFYYRYDNLKQGLFLCKQKQPFVYRVSFRNKMFVNHLLNSFVKEIISYS